MFDGSFISEKEANLFAAELLLEDGDVPESPIQVNSNFMRNMEIPDNVDYYIWGLLVFLLVNRMEL